MGGGKPKQVKKGTQGATEVRAPSWVCTLRKSKVGPPETKKGGKAMCKGGKNERRRDHQGGRKSEKAVSCTELRAAGRGPKTNYVTHRTCPKQTYCISENAQRARGQEGKKKPEPG